VWFGRSGVRSGWRTHLKIAHQGAFVEVASKYVWTKEPLSNTMPAPESLIEIEPQSCRVGYLDNPAKVSDFDF
jgi:hypothetical protein